MAMSPNAELKPIPVQTQSEQQMFLRNISQVPSLLKALIDKDITTDAAISLADAYRLDGARNKAMIFLEGEVIVKHISPSEVLPFVRQHIIADDTQAKKFSFDFLGKICLPMQWYIGNVEGLITELGGDVEKYTAEAQKNYPEVYAPDAQKSASVSVAETPAIASGTSATLATEEEPAIVRDIGEKLSSSKGRAGVLLHLVALSQKIEQAGTNGKLNAKETGELLHSLDALSYAVNTQDLNPLEIAAIKRRLKNILAKVGE